MTHQRRREPRVEHVVVASQRALIPPGARLRRRFGLVVSHVGVAGVVVPGGNLVSPPQLTRDAPVLDAVEPLVVDVDPVLGHELHVAPRHHIQRHLGDRLPRKQGALGCWFRHGDKPLIGEHRLDDRSGAAAARHHQPVRLDRLEQPGCAQVVDDAPAGVEAVEAAIGHGAVVADLRVEREDLDAREAVAFADRIVVEVVRRRDLDAAGAERRVDIGIGNHRDGAIAQRQLQLAADQMPIPFIVGIHGNRNVAQHGFRAGGRHHQAAHAVDRTFGERIQDVPEAAVLFLALDFEIGDCRAQHRIPVDQSLAAINQALPVQSHEGVGDHRRQLRIHGEVLALPVARVAQPSHLAGDGRAGRAFPFPDLVDERLAAQVTSDDALGLELSLDHDLRGDAGVIGAGDPDGVEAAHPVIAGERVHDGLVERVPHVQGAGDIRRR